MQWSAFIVMKSDLTDFMKKKGQTTCEKPPFVVSAKISVMDNDYTEPSTAVVSWVQLLSAFFLLNKSSTVMRGFYSQFRCLTALRKS